MKKKFFLIITAVCALMGVCTYNAPLTSNNLLIAEAQTPFPSTSEWNMLSKVDLNLLSFLASTGVIDTNTGALGRNRPSFISVGFQRYSSRFITYGILTKNIKLIEIGILGIEYPLKYQQPDGSFIDYSSGILGTSHPGSVAFYMHDVGHSIVLCQNSQWFQGSTETGYLRSRIEKLKPAVTSSLDWLMLHQSNLVKGDGNGNGTNRLWVDANAFYLTGRALKRADAVSLGGKFATLALQQQSSTGAFLEKNGFDSSYQGVSLQQALVYFTNLSSNAAQRPLVWAAIQRGIQLEMKYILPTGELQTEGNTRVYAGGEAYFGLEKNVDYLALIQSLNYYYVLTQDPIIKSAADRTYAYYRRPK